jgi:transketolase
MRGEFFKLLKEEMGKDKSVFLLIADMGLGLVEPIQKEFPDRYLNIGISEQNMIGIAAGLCNTGFRPFCYTISNFLIERCYEQIRNDMCLHKYPVTLVGTSTGFDNGMLGPTHQVIDDIGCLKALPEIAIYSPGSISCIGKIFSEIKMEKRPAYVRIGKSSYKTPAPPESINHMVVKSSKPDVLAITHGTMLENCIAAAGMTSRLSVYAMNKVKPLEPEKIKALFREYSKIVVIEDHFGTSGLYNSLCQYLADFRDVKPALYSLSTPGKYEEVVGNSAFFADRYGYSPAKIASFVETL